MMRTQEEKIQDYIDGLLEGEELADFQQQLSSNANLQAQLNFQTEVQALLQRRLSRDDSDIRQHLKQAESNIRSKAEPKGRNKLIRYVIPILAAACVLFVLKFFVFKASELYELPLMDSEVVRGATDTGKYEDAVVLFNKQSYGEARAILEELIRADSLNTQYRYYEGLSYYGEGKWAQAMEKLQPLAEGESVFAREASYYLAVCYMRLDQDPKALNVLQSIQGVDEIGEKAQKLRNKLQQ